ncbi:GntR family transcriptional regulator [Timonella senegalensis]|uniref:GntR family transcriptional regulator n=1 Tax=Timonella senegalensis TaxID=1465825 RepID=UPI00030F4E0A|nr:GntR family transcriptional regulator [Timonella senegalensis]
MSQSVFLPWERPEPQPVAQKIASDVARRIVERTPGYEPGAFLIEAEIAREAGASRTPGREAMLQLERWGLVRMIPKKGATVTLADDKEIADLISVRSMLESDATRQLSASQGESDPSLASDLRVLLDRQQASVTSQDVLAFAADDYRFHSRIIQSGGNQVVMTILDDLGPRLARILYQTVIRNPHLIEKFHKEHEQLADYLLTSDFDGFSAMARAHVFAAHIPTETLA